MANAYGFIEITGVTAAIDAADIMCKTAAVTLTAWERKLGGRLVTLIVEGDVAAVDAATRAVIESGIRKPVAMGILANPHPEIIRLVKQSANKLIHKKTKNRRKKNV
jgi:microcompartment protein CcmL/EutN